jgi:hypothetical protein
MHKLIQSSLAGALALTASVAVSVPAQAADFDFSGTFENDNDVLLFNFTLDTDSSITLFSSSWANGGFDPILSLFDSAGNLIDQQDDGGYAGSTFSNGVSYDHGTWDFYYTPFLASDSYLASITQFSNFTNGYTLSDGFFYDGAGNENFTGVFGCSQGQFCGVGGDDRTNVWELHVLDVKQASIVNQPASVPEPASALGLLAMGALSAGSLLKRKQEA